ncbi:hypothetical protein rsdtw13_08290 [Clostridium sp. TW13]|uniref:Uncharacterized protein n=1 Tax=Inconstantimicrobium mannanitabidum TaxID=1604901 RepID=A0ACB5R960_9CLOT|nr:hypothetical protein rsdtw13_08290 [Clostridium sp. TW13]
MKSQGLYICLIYRLFLCVKIPIVFSTLECIMNTLLISIDIEKGKV